MICGDTDCSRRRNWILTSDPKKYFVVPEWLGFLRSVHRVRRSEGDYKSMAGLDGESTVHSGGSLVFGKQAELEGVRADRLGSRWPLGGDCLLGLWMCGDCFDCAVASTFRGGGGGGGLGADGPTFPGGSIFQQCSAWGDGRGCDAGLLGGKRCAAGATRRSSFDFDGEGLGPNGNGYGGGGFNSAPLERFDDASSDAGGGLCFLGGCGNSFCFADYFSSSRFGKDFKWEESGGLEKGGGRGS